MDDRGDIALIGVDLSIEAAHIGGGEFVVEISESGAEFGKFFEGVVADDGDGVVRREIVAIIFEGDEMEGVDQAVRGIAGDDVDLMIDEGAVEEAEVHNVWRSGEMERVTIAPAGETVGSLEEFVANTGAPLGSDRSEVGHGVEVEGLRVVLADDHGESVFEAEGFGEVKIKFLGVLLFDAVIDLSGRVLAGGFVEDGGQGGTGVFDVEVKISGEEGFVDEKSAAEIGFAVHRDVGAGFDVLGEEFGEDDLLGEKFGADG